MAYRSYTRSSSRTARRSSYNRSNKRSSYRARGNSYRAPARKRSAPRARQQTIKVVLQMVPTPAALPIGQKPVLPPRKGKFA